jgi:hypothetical protein
MDYKKICKALIAEIRRLRAEVSNLEEMLEYSNAAIARIQGSYEQQYWEERRRREREESERFWREYHRQQLVQKLERAREWGNDWEEERILRELRSYY